MGAGFEQTVQTMTNSAVSTATTLLGQMGPWITVYIALGVVALAIAIFRKAGV